jgi:hypothetical protein
LDDQIEELRSSLQRAANFINEMEEKLDEASRSEGKRSELRKEFAKTEEIQKREAAIGELKSIGRPAVAALVDSLASSSTSLRLGAIQILGAIGDQRAIVPLGNLTQAAGLRDAVKLAVDSIRSRQGLNATELEKVSVSSSNVSFASASTALTSFISGISTGKQNDGQTIKLIETLLKQGPVTVDLDAESFIEKENGQVRLLGWGFIEALRALEQKLPDHILNQIKIRIVNLNRTIKSSEIEEAMGITPELKGMIEIMNVPVNHQRFIGVVAYLGSESLKIGSERNMLLWRDRLDIVVKSPKKGEAIDGRKLFLASLLHARLKKQLPDYVKKAVERLLSGLNLEIASGVSFFNPDSRARLDFAFIRQLDRINKLLSQAA